MVFNTYELLRINTNLIWPSVRLFYIIKSCRYLHPVNRACSFCLSRRRNQDWRAISLILQPMRRTIRASLRYSKTVPGYNAAIGTYTRGKFYPEM